ncbi:MAG: leucine-rich repeat protein [Oscillospiraceae bacterium]|nr:leucine-rich repeat protein [Oscillospiraceae bacterium]MBR6120414.1 leucine-rich repeat protein [Oscillospiraceae bacterium]
MKKKISKRTFSFLLALVVLCIVLPQFPLIAHAETYSGTCGDNLTWSLNTTTGVLQIKGSGAMTYGSGIPWKEYRESIKELRLPDGLTSICDSAFYGCSLESVTIPSSVTSIGEEAFGYTDLKTVTIPKNLTSIGKNAFVGCYSLTAFSVAAGNPAYSSDANGVLFNSNQQLLLYPHGKTSASYTVPAGVTAICSDAFCGHSALKNVNLPDSLTWIGQNAFSYCDGLTSVHIPTGVTEIGYRAFAECTALTSVVLPPCAYTTHYGTDGYVFQGCSALISLTIPEGCTQIGCCDFTGCTALEAVTFPSTMARLENGAFWGCTALKSVTLSKGIWLGPNVFRYCLGLTAINVDPDNPYYSSDDSGVLFNKDKTALICCPGGKAGSYTIPEGVTTIEDYAFGHCHKLTAVKLPGSLTTINNYALFDCTEMKSIKIPASVTTIGFGLGREVRYPGQPIIEGFTIYGYTDTEAQTYAQECGITFVPLDPETGFSDVKASAYYHDAVLWAVQNSVTGGTSEFTFSPKNPCKREQVATFLYAAARKPGHETAETPFSDVTPKKYFYDAVMWAVENGITGGVGDGTRFGVGKPCTREQVVTFLWKAAGAPEPTNTDCSFTDVKPSKYYYKAVLWAVENGVTSGASADKFGVGKSCTRAQIVTFLYNVYGK